ncbi:zinc carboxypeptidase-like isoform X1 [Neodiprion virginianus]|uniref:zinc carboxypeptidase-like isoform X1 n=1 Tax=Neodiprion virginianus TaxID=2961670 RepID=UPI001EE74355|nr:zinc carboxypeptidase-like isoform X1 [Neodiprion virginianus]
MKAIALFSVACAILIVGDALPTPEEGYKRYDGHKVYRVTASTREHLNLLKFIEDQAKEGILFWTSAGALNSDVDVMVSPEREDEILSTFESVGISYKTLIEDVQTLVENENPEIGWSLRADEATSLNWTAYHRLDVIYNWLDELAETYPDLVEVIVIGNSYEGRLIKGIKITFDEDNPGIFIEGGIHAREWITPATVTYLTNEILTSTNDAFNLIARAHNWFIFPSTNPDGYEYTHTTNRMWRKTRQPYDNDCWGADPNRNWDYYWLANGGASNNSCSETYAGSEPFSEVEVKALADYIATVSDKFYIYLSIHSYSQLILLPYGYTYDHLDNYEEAMHVGEIAAAALARRYGTEYIVGSTAEAIYVASGSSTDYVKAIHKTPIVYCYEFRDTGTYGFLLPAEQIIPNSLEFIDSLIAVIGETRNLGYPEIHTIG